jgi:hypothetical protein
VRPKREYRGLVRLRTLTEAEAYARCYGEGDDTVRFVKIEARRPRLFYGVSGEDLRRAFETRLQKREPAHEPIPEAVAEPVAEPITGSAVNGHKPAAAA